ncbi:hypothetical protein F0L74_28380 [Chitinophaga agrisoli]|uniref:Uncharacterized protein n=1 Tax=Chitinophaga agrisoli TaxID=2607653 RepID=A0A5B2VN46_9BACT|nr:hypothetical protein [Chitinophaga agrisoli]KAA2240090.1 hypothetical protein F0L74_28380 [Chitinophaga agrisoli]
MAKSNQPSYKGRPVGHSNFAGVSGGTVLVLLARNLPDSYPIKSWLVIAAPSITVAISFLWRFAVNQAKNAMRNWEIARSTDELLHEIEQLLKDPNIPECEKQRLLAQKQAVRFTRLEELTKKLANKRAAP